MLFPWNSLVGILFWGSIEGVPFHPLLSLYSFMKVEAIAFHLSPLLLIKLQNTVDIIPGLHCVIHGCGLLNCCLLPFSFPGSGGYADNSVGATSTTGHGESIMKVILARLTLYHMEQGISWCFRSFTLYKAWSNSIVHSELMNSVIGYFSFEDASCWKHFGHATNTDLGANTHKCNLI